MKQIALIILILFAENSFSQNEKNKIIDSLKTELSEAKEDTSKVNILNQLASNNFYGKPKLAVQYGEIALKLSSKIHWKKGMAIANNNLGISYWVDANYAESIKYFQKTLLYYQDLKNPNGISDTYNHLGLLHLEIENYRQAFIYLFKAYKINRQTKDKIATGYNLGSIAKTFHKIKNYEKALDYYIKSKEIYKTLPDKNGVGDCYNKIGKIYEDQKQYEKALEYYNKALNNFDESAKYYLSDSYLEIGRANYHLSLKPENNKAEKLKLSIQYLNKALVLFTEFGTFGKINECHQELHKAYRDNGNYRLSLEHFEKNIEIKDNILSYKNEVKLGELKNKKEIELRNKQIEIQKLKINNDSKKVYFLVFITFFIAILFILFFYLYIFKTSTNRLLIDKNREISNINKQKDKFFSIIAHDLRGPFSGFLGLTELLAEDINSMDKEDIEFAAVNMKSSAHNLNRLLDNLLEWSRMEQGLVPFTPKKYNLLKAVKESTATLQDTADKKNIIIETAINESLEIYADHHILQSVIRNILSNAIKFTPREGRIKIQAKKETNGTMISICDTGIGMDAKMLENIFQLDVKNNRKGTEDEPSSGLGLILCKEFIEKHRGKIWIESEVNKGSCFYFSFPHAIA
jgi:signal transduction histidine kinase/TPR repeat protein